jgi:hypothetical protein
MNPTTTTVKNTDAQPKRRGFGQLPCPKCGEDAAVRLDLDDLNVCSCRNCDEEFEIGLIRDLMAKWGPVLQWIDAAPELKEE